jgi:hypothetical protein
MIQAKARSIFQSIKVYLSDPEAKFEAINGWLHALKPRKHFRHVKLSGEAASTGIKAAESSPYICRKITEVGFYASKSIMWIKLDNSKKTA